MRRAGAVSVSGALLLALLCIALISLWPDPVGAQADPLVGQEAEIEDTAPDDGRPDRVLIAFPQDQTCSLDEDTPATITVEDGGTPPTSATFTEGEGGATIAEVGNQIVVTVAESAQFPTDFVESPGSVVSSGGIICTADAASEPPNAPACPTGTSEVETFTSDDTTFGPFTIAEEDFQVRYAVETEQETPTEEESFSFSVLQGEDPVEQSGAVAVTETVTEEALAVDDAGPGDFRLEVDSEGVVFAITVCEGEAAGDGGGGGGGGDLNCDDFDSQADAQAAFDAGTTDPNNLDADDDGEACEDFPYGDIIDDGGDNDDDDLPETGGPPLALFAGLCFLAALLLAARALTGRGA